MLNQESEFHLPIIIVGGGIIGLTIAYELIKSGFKDFCILEKSQYLGDHTSGRNSGVLHAGLYYEENSFKKKFCLDGLELWKKFTSDNNLFYRNCGKFIFAENHNKNRLEELFEKALKNGADVRWSNPKEHSKIINFCKSDLSFFSKNTSIVDPSECIHFLKNYVESKGIPILYNQDITYINLGNRIEIEVNNEQLTCDHLVNACGLGSVALRKLAGLKGIESKFVRGSYLRFNGPFYNDALLYPLPLKNLKGLGVHTCIDPDGSVKFGPNAKDIENISYEFSSSDITEMKEEIFQTFHISKDYLSPDFCGIRPKVMKNGEVVKDFMIGHSHGYHEYLGIESPGLTSSLAIAKDFVQNIL